MWYSHRNGNRRVLRIIGLASPTRSLRLPEVKLR